MTGDKDFDAILESCFKVLKLKGVDYTIGSTDRLANFRKVAEFTGMTMEQVWAVYFAKHVFAVFAYVKGGTESEPIEGRIVDCVNYALLLGKLVAEKKRMTAPPAPEVFKPVDVISTVCLRCRLPAKVNASGWCFACFSNTEKSP